MASSLAGLLSLSSTRFRETLKYKSFIESLRGVLLRDPATSAIMVPKELTYLYRGDLTGLLLELKIPKTEHYIVMRVNQLTSIHQVDSTLSVIYRPDSTTINRFEQLYKQSLGK